MRTFVLAVAIVVGSLPLGTSPANAAACDTPGQPTTTVYLPNITKTLGGANGWVTPFIVQNVGTAATTLEVSFYRFSDGTLVTCRKIAGVLPYTSYPDVPNNDTDLPGDSQFGVVVRSFGAQVVAVVNEHQGLQTPARAEALSYVGLSTGANSLALPYVAKAVNGWLVTFVMQNLGTAIANAGARFVSYDGMKTATLTRQIAPGASQFVNPAVEAQLIDGTEYSVTLTSDQPIAAIANAHNDAPTTPAPMGFSYNAVASTAGPVYVPSVSRNADGVGRTSRIVVQNAGPADATPSLSFQRSGAAPVTVAAPAPVKSGAAWRYDPVTLSDGEWGLVATGGQLAVLAIALTPVTALGSTGIAAPGNRAFLPNVTRTLGGLSGWTTPIVLQSAGATSATLRWYRFADGTLATRQTVAGLANGLPMRIDPLAVPGLTDDTQYAVVVDAQGGNLAATVLELSFSGGDGAMAYEGFKATVSPVPQPTAISLSPATSSVTAGGTTQFAATVKDQFDNPLAGAVTWSVTPASLGTITSAGAFTASTVAAGPGIITATSGTIAATAQITVAAPQTATVGGISFRVDTSGAADVYTEASLTTADASNVVAIVNADMAQTATDFARPYAKRPRAYALATTPTYITALQTILGLPAGEAQQSGTVSTGIFVENTNAVAVNWEKAKASQPVSAFRHELTHLMEHQIVPTVDIPAWLDEGTARSEEFTVPNGTHRIMENRYSAASMAATGTLFTLAEMTSVQTWNNRSEPGAAYQYFAASQAVQLLRTDLGLAGTNRIFDLMGQGRSFDSAYQAVTGQAFTVFAAAYPARVRALATTYPGIATAPDTAAGPGLSITFYGFTPNAQLTITVGGAASSAPSTVTVTPYGTYKTYLGSTWPPGSYTITASSAGATVTLTTAKASSVLMLDADPFDPGAMVLTLPQSPD